MTHNTKQSTKFMTPYRRFKYITNMEMTAYWTIFDMLCQDRLAGIPQERG